MDSKPAKSKQPKRDTEAPPSGLPIEAWQVDPRFNFGDTMPASVAKALNRIERALEDVQTEADEEAKLYGEALAALGPLQRRLLEFMWERKLAFEGEVIEHVWGHDSDRAGRNLKTLISRMHKRLLDEGVKLGWSLHRSGGMVIKE